MRHLKTKLAKARESKLVNKSSPEDADKDQDWDLSDDAKDLDIKIEEGSQDSPSDSTVSKPVKDKRKTKNPKEKKVERGATSAKNIVKNYGRALANFAASNLALPYLTRSIERENVRLKDFRRFISSKKKRARCIAGLRQLLVVEAEDTEHIAAFKRIFKEVSIIFIKYFSVNWIFSGKLCDKMTHLKYRFKILRRIRSPEHFTYLKGFS